MSARTLWLGLILQLFTVQVVNAGTYLEQGDAALARSDVAQAIQYYQAEIRNTPDSIYAKLGLVKVYLLTRKNDYAKSILDEVLVQSPKNTDALLILAQYFISENNMDAAANTLKRVIALDSKNIPAHEILVQVYKAKGDFVQEDAINNALSQLQKPSH